MSDETEKEREKPLQTRCYSTLEDIYKFNPHNIQGSVIEEIQGGPGLAQDIKLQIPESGFKISLPIKSVQQQLP